MTKKEKLMHEFYSYAKGVCWEYMYGPSKVTLERMLFTGRMAVYQAILDDLEGNINDIQQRFEDFKRKHPKCGTH